MVRSVWPSPKRWARVAFGGSAGCARGGCDLAVEVRLEPPSFSHFWIRRSRAVRSSVAAVAGAPGFLAFSSVMSSTLKDARRPRTAAPLRRPWEAAPTSLVPTTRYAGPVSAPGQTRGRAAQALAAGEPQPLSRMSRTPGRKTARQSSHCSPSGGRWSGRADRLRVPAAEGASPPAGNRTSPKRLVDGAESHRHGRPAARMDERDEQRRS